MVILIVDDEKEFVEFLKERLTIKGHSVDFAYDGKKALDLIKSNHYDLIFSDHNMPELTGLELVKYLKENKINSKIVMITGYPEIDEFFMKGVGADDYLNKPVKIQDVEALIEKYSQSF